VNTVVYHRRQLYASLGVASRAELLECLALGDMV
jgi:DNA-binding CsgD family transcriptional regulator